ncbi:segregation and condensation protein A [Roseicella frigidaeris]|uniref:Segregation and condensation protein A n=1 Tax=Roseicella frigidaeris TaxID=2230885 RepID=A0A327M3J4_9PROT|nr:ScpA family protein [Roseicella frigidaeris]RAI54638.1 segregation/condensation protein A [Roseicella frigidaeris]
MTPEADSAEAFLDASPAAVGNSGAPALRLGAYEGPLDLLLELARAQRVDLSQLSVATLAEQFEAVVAAAIEQQAVPLPRLADWLIMAAWLTLLRSRLLLPAAAAESAEAEREAQGLRRRLADREWASRLADWLEQRPQLGRQVFARGEAEPNTTINAGAPPLADTAELLRACLRLLVLPHRDRVYRPRPPTLWRVPDALERMRELLPKVGEGADLTAFLPPPSEERVRSQLQQRAALATTFMAGLELGRDGLLALSQAEAFGTLRLIPGRDASTPEGELNVRR